MALSLRYETAQGVILDNAYIRIDDIGGNKERLSIRVRVYSSEEGFRAGKESFCEELYTLAPSVADNSPNFIRQGYEYLKSLPEYEMSIDIFE